jgi:hypothetical protein
MARRARTGWSMTAIAPIGATHDGELVVDLDELIGSHLAAIANSGGGKSSLVRKLLETTHGAIQQIALDPEDQFYTLRERFDYVIAGGDNGDVPATPENAAELARMALEHGFSLIVQISDLKAKERSEFVRNFIDGLMGAPQAFWRPVLVVIDEVQFFADPKVPTVAAAAIADLTGRGRKRGYTAILAGLRMSQIDASIRGNINNWMLGRVGQSLDRNIMADQLGMTQREGREKLGAIDKREFYALGPAIAREPTYFRVGDTLTTIVKRGQHRLPTPPAPEAMRAILADVANMSAEAVALQQQAQAVGAVEAGAAASHALRARDVRIHELEQQLSQVRVEKIELGRSLVKCAAAVRDAYDALRTVVIDEIPAVVAGDAAGGSWSGPPAAGDTKDLGPPATLPPAKPKRAAVGADVKPLAPTAALVPSGGVEPLNEAAIDMAAVLKGTAPADWSWEELAIVTVRRPGSGWMGKARKAIVSRGWIASQAGGRFIASEALQGEEAIPARDMTPSDELIGLWASALRGPGGAILEDLATHGSATKEEIGRRVGMSSSSGWFGKGMKDLTRSNLVTVMGKTVRLNNLLIEGDADA